MTLSLDSSLARFARAEEHVGALRRQIDEWTRGGKSHRVERKASSDFTRHALVFKILQEPDLRGWSLTVSDAIHNFRCALDHLIYAVAVHHGGIDPPIAEGRLAFPICDTPELFADKRTQRRIDTLSAEVRASIERFQPYNRPHAVLPPLLKLLRELDDANKHRLVRLVTTQVRQATLGNLNYGIDPKESILVQFHDGEVTDGVELYVVTVNRPTPDLDFTFRLDLTIALPHPPGPPPDEIARSGVGRLLNELGAEVRLVTEDVRSVAGAS